MKKKHLLFIFSSILAISIVTIVKEENTIEKTQTKYADFLKNHHYNETLKLSKKERKSKGMPPNKYFEQEYLNEINPYTGRTHPENVLIVQQELKQQRKLQRVPGDAADNPWVERGPNNVGGRTRVVMFDPNDATNKRVFAGGVSGGLWVNNDITDKDSEWQKIGIAENLAINCMTVDPNDSQTFYLGTGESYTGDDAVGNGVWKSTDGGTSWTNVYSDSFNTDLTARLFYINDIIAWNNPTTNSTDVFIGVGGAYYGEGAQWAGFGKTGLFKSVDDGDTWVQVTLPAIPGEDTIYEPNDLEIGSDNTIWIGTGKNAYGDGGGTILKSLDGSTFTSAHTISDVSRTEIAVSKTNENKIYILGEGTTVAKPLMMYSTSDAFASAPSELEIPNDKDTGIPANDFTRGQAFYDLVIEVDPTDDAVIYVGGIDLFRSTDSGQKWKQISKWSNNNLLGVTSVSLVHADQHGFVFHPSDANKAVIGNDGGVFYANNLSEAYFKEDAIQARNKEYNVTQFYHGEIGQDPSNELLVSGSQDNGTQFINAAAAGINSTEQVYGGDGAYSFIDKDGEYMIVSYVYNTQVRLDLPYTGAGVQIANDQNTGRFINPSDLDDNLDILYANSSGGSKDSIARFSNLKGTPVRKNFSNSKLIGEATAFKVSPFTSTSTTLFVGTSKGRILRIDNANGNPIWNGIKGNISTGNVLIPGSISSIEFGSNESEIMITYHNYGIPSIWHTTNGGVSWVNKEGDLPDIPVKAIMMNPLNNDEVIIGTQLGVWRTSNFKDENPNWTQSYNGMSNVKVTSFSLRTADNTVMASTYGRGMFTGQFATGVASIDEVLNERATFTMYPTVSSGDFTLFAKNTLGKSRLQLFDVRGREVYTKQIDFTQQERQLISVNLEAGVYIAHLTDASNKKATGKVIIK